MEVCLEIFCDDPVHGAKARRSLADLFDEQGDVVQAVAQHRRALALWEQLPDPGERALSHNNMAFCLDRQSTPAALAEAAQHWLAAFVYFLAAGIGQHVRTVLGNYARAFRRAHAAGAEFVIPRLSELLADPAFEPLQRWLTQRQVNVDGLQAVVDGWLEQVRQAVISEDSYD